MIYLDHASTSFPKPREVISSIDHFLTTCGISPGKGAHPLAYKAEDLVAKTRQSLSRMIGGDRPDHVVFTNNATHSLNLAIKGYLKNGDHALICSYSHNSVIRPIDRLKRMGIITYDTFQIDQKGDVDLEQFEASIKDHTRLVICNHASNVLGVVAPVAKLIPLCRARGIAFLLDCTQSLGYFPIDLSVIPVDFLVGTGHKTLLGPMGIGFLYIRNPDCLEPLFEGGSSGNHSISPFHPSIVPYKFEAGTINMTGIAGLRGALDYIDRVSYAQIAEKSMALTQYAWDQLSELKEVILYGTEEMSRKVPIISFNIRDMIPSEAAEQYHERYQICLRSGLQCAPLTHKVIGTLPTGTLRISFGHLNSREEIDHFIRSTKEIIKNI